MRKLRKMGTVLLSAALVFSGCGNVQEAVSDDVVITEAPELTQEPDVTQAEEKLHPITAGGVDYLSTEGIYLEPGAEIAMVATDSENPFYDMVEQGAVQAVKDLNEMHGYSGKKKIALT